MNQKFTKIKNKVASYNDATKTKKKIEYFDISPMMPMRFSAREREEIRKKEVLILKGYSN